MECEKTAKGHKAAPLCTPLGLFYIVQRLWNAERCYKYCQRNEKWQAALQSHKLIHASSLIGYEKNTEDWYTKRENFIDVDVSYKCSQTYGG